MEEIQSIKRMITEGDPHDAIRLLEEYVKRQPESDEAWFLLGKAHYKLGEIRLALNSYLRAMELNPEFVAEIMKSIHEESVRVQMEIMK